MAVAAKGNGWGGGCQVGTAGPAEAQRPKPAFERLPYPDGGFDTVTAACVFCSVGDPVRGLQETARVARPGGQVLLYEHVRPRNPVLGKITDLVSPLTRRLFGPELNRPTERNVETAGLRVPEIRRRGIWREIIATSRRP